MSCPLDENWVRVFNTAYIWVMGVFPYHPLSKSGPGLDRERKEKHCTYRYVLKKKGAICNSQKCSPCFLMVFCNPFICDD